MSVKLTNKLEKGNHVVTLNITGDAWKKALDKAQKGLFDNLEIKGFRKGKVPANIAEQYIKPANVQGKASEMVIDKEYGNVIELLQKEQIITRPEIQIVKLSDTEFEATFSSAVMPEVKLGKTSGFTAKVEEAKASKEEVEKEIEKFSAHLKTTKEISEDREIKEGDVVNFDFEGKKDGVPFDGGKAEGYELEIGSGQFIPGFEEQMKGMKKGEEKVLELTFPENYPQPDLAGADVTFDVKVNAIKEKVDLEGKELEERLKAMGFESADDMKAKIEMMLNEQKAAAANDKFYNAVVEEILDDKGTEIEIPEALIKDEVANQLKTFEQQLAKQGMTLDAYLEMLKKSKDEFMKENLQENAERRIKGGLVYSQLLKDLKVEVTEDMLKAKVEEIAKQQGVDVKDFEKNVNIEAFKGALLFEELVKKLQA